MEKGLKTLCIFILLFFIQNRLFCAEVNYPCKMIVTVPVADVRHKPIAIQTFSYDKLDWLQNTQVLFGEKIIAYEHRNGWLRIKTMEQQIFVNNQWHYYSGWIRANQAKVIDTFPVYNLVVSEPWAPIRTSKTTSIEVSLGTQLKGVSLRNGLWKVKLPDEKTGYISACNVKNCLNSDTKVDLRASLISTAEKFIGMPYFWGGRSVYNKELLHSSQQTSVDCSALVGLCFRVNGIDVARNSPSIYQQCKKLKKNLLPGDLIFFARKNDPATIFHISFYVGEDNIIESRGKDVREVRKVSCLEAFGKQIQDAMSGDAFSDGYLFFGSIL